MNLSRFGQLMAADSPIVNLMEDLGEALNRNPDLLFLGGGNPAHVPSVARCFQDHTRAVADSAALQPLLGVYQSPQGDAECLQQLAIYLRETCGWSVSERNIALVNGSQTAFFILLNALAGPMGPDVSIAGSQKAVLPLVPEYLGYASQGLAEAFFRVQRPQIHKTRDKRFKYGIDFGNLELGADAGVLCVSRPTNPSGNCLTDGEIEQLAGLASERGIPFIIDAAYGQPFPSVVYTDAKPYWDPGIVYVLSLSKLGMPGLRTGIVVANPDIIELVTRANTIVSLASGNWGPALLSRLLSSGDLPRLIDSGLVDFYRTRRDGLIGALARELEGVAYRIHEAEGAFFLWLWFEDLPITSMQLYQRLKEQGVLIMAGEPFFFGLDRDWPHARQCIRLTYCQPPAVLEGAARLIGQVLRELR